MTTTGTPTAEGLDGLVAGPGALSLRSFGQFQETCPNRYVHLAIMARPRCRSQDIFEHLGQLHPMSTHVQNLLMLNPEITGIMDESTPEGSLFGDAV